MMANPGMISELLTDVITRGAVVAEKRRVIWALGFKYDKPSVWARLLDAWEELDEERGSLRGLELWATTLVLVKEGDPNKQPAICNVVDWAA